MRQKKFFINKSLVLKTKNTLTFLIVTYFRNQKMHYIWNVYK